MLQLYRQVRKPIIAVAPLIRERPALLRNFGIAALANRPVLESSNRLFYIDGELSEKPSDPFVHALTHKIVGRYLFTPELFEALTDHNLTAAINRAWVKSKSNAICGYVVEQPLASIGRLKDIIADMDTKQIFDPEFYR
jgi:UTP-glucose-1-phosphate uridylyltransferase